MKLYDRLNKKNINITEIEEPIIFGRYLVMSSDDYSVNYQENLFLSFLVPCDNLKVLFSKGKNFIKIFDKNPLIIEESSLVNNTLLDISTKMQKENISFEHISPLLVNFEEKLNIDGRDEFNEKNLYHIEEICKDPAYKLGSEASKVNISRAKRIPTKAISYLASHTEDWSRRTITGIQPKKIIAESFTYDLQIYENKVTVKIIDNLIFDYENRFKEAESIEKYLEEIEKILKSNSYTNSWNRRTRRVLAVIGESLRKTTDGETSKQLDDNKTKYKDLKDFISKMLSKLLNLKSTDIYKKNQNIFLPSGKIHRTNLLDNHKHYRYIRNFYDNIDRKTKPTCEEIAIANTKLANAFINYSWLLISRALLLIGFDVDKKIDNREILFQSDKYNFIVTATRDNYKNINIICLNKSIKFIPIPHTKINIQKVIENEYYLILDDNISTNNNRIVKISPNQINSEERVAKKLFEMIFIEFMNNYYLPFDNYQLVSQHELNSIKEWIAQEKELFIISENNTKIKITKYFSNNYEQNFEKHRKSQILKPNKKVRDQQNHAMQDIKLVLLESRKHFKIYSSCIACNKNIDSSFDYGITFCCQNKDCAVNYGFKIINNKKKYFYHVPHFKDILKLNPIIEDVIGYEHVDI